MSLLDLARDATGESGRIIALRHDVDFDVENALKLARWESARGFRASYYLLHTGWYWRVVGASLSKQMVDAAMEMQDLGHEVGLHNDAISVALASGRRPADVLWMNWMH